MKPTKLNSKSVRYYNPSTARFLSRDPIGFDSGDTNLYRYVENNPTNEIDPLGLYQVCNRPLRIPGGSKLMSSNLTISHTYIRYRDGSSSSFGDLGGVPGVGPGGALNEPGGEGETCSKDTGSDEQEKKMKKWAENNINRQYNINSYNCKNFTIDVLLNGN